MENKVEIQAIEKLEVKAKIIALPVEGGEKGETENHIYTEVKFLIEGTPGQFDGVLMALAAGHSVSVSLGSPQSVLSLD